MATHVSLGWQDESGEAQWWQLDQRWIACWRYSRRRQGAYISSRQSMISFVHEGELCVQFGPRRQQLTCRPGDALLIEQGTPFTAEMAAGTALSMVETVAHSAAGPALGRVAAARLSPDLSRRLARAWWSPRALLALDEVADAGWEPQAAEPVHNTRRMLAVKAYLDAHFREPVRLTEVARRFNMDSFYLSRAFTKTTTISPKLYLQSLRREHFLRQLLMHARRRTFTHLASDAGFDDYAAFCRLIRRDLGVPPSALLREPIKFFQADAASAT